MEETEEYVHKPYRINEGDIITIIRQDVEKDGNKWTFYKVATKNKVDDTQTYYKALSFPKDTDIPDGARIRINSMVEYARHKDKFNDTYYLFIEDYELLDKQTSKEAIEEYKESVDTIY